MDSTDTLDLESFLKEKGLWHRFIEKPETVHTSDASKETGIGLDRLTKALILLDQDRNPLLAIIPGNSKLSFFKIKEVSKRKRVRLVPFDDAKNYSGYPPGATPMICHECRMDVFLDSSLVGFDTIFGGGGTRTRILELKTSDVITINEATVCDITE